MLSHVRYRHAFSVMTVGVLCLMLFTPAFRPTARAATVHPDIELKLDFTPWVEPANGREFYNYCSAGAVIVALDAASPPGTKLPISNPSGSDTKTFEEWRKLGDQIGMPGGSLRGSKSISRPELDGNAFINRMVPYLNKQLNTTGYRGGTTSTPDDIDGDKEVFTARIMSSLKGGYALITTVSTAYLGKDWDRDAAHIVAVYGIKNIDSGDPTILYMDTAGAGSGYTGPHEEEILLSVLWKAVSAHNDSNDLQAWWEPGPGTTPSPTPVTDPLPTGFSASPRGATFRPGEEFHPLVVVKPSAGISLNCATDFLENRDGRVYEGWPIAGCVKKSGNYVLYFHTPLRAPMQPGTYHSRWQFWSASIFRDGYVGPVIDLWFRVSAAGSTGGVHKTFYMMPGETQRFPVSVGAGRTLAGDSMALDGGSSSSTSVSDGQLATYRTEWGGGDFITTLTSPSGRTIGRASADDDVIHQVGPNFEAYSVLDSEPGEWQVAIFGADVPPQGESVNFDFSAGGDEPPPPELAYVDGTTLILNMGSAERRSARYIATDEINEEFTIQQLGSTLPGEFSVSAFGLTLTFSGVTKIQADADDGNDLISLGANADETNADAPNTSVGFTAPAIITGGDGDDILHAGDGADTLSGGPGSDTIDGGGGNDSIAGDDGADGLSGGGGQDTVTGGGGDDMITGGADSDTLSGDDGGDTIGGDDGADLLTGGSGNDAIMGGAGNDTIRGDADNDRLEGGPGADSMEGNAGDDRMFGDDGADTMHGDDGADTMHGGSDADRIDGDTGDDLIYGDDGPDLIHGNAGNDTISGGEADDYVEGNEGADTMFGEAGQDDLIGGSMIAGVGDQGDHIVGGPDQDVIVGDNASITRPGGTNLFDRSVKRTITLLDIASHDPTVSGADDVHGDGGNDHLYGQHGNDTLAGGAGDDVMEGNQGDDVLHGGGDADDMLGGSSSGNGVIGSGVAPTNLPDGRDTIAGDAGDDVILGDNGTITRPTDSHGLWQWIQGSGFNLVVRSTSMAMTPEHPHAYGNDSLWGGDGADDLYGQLGDDYLDGGAGEDALVGDLGQVTNRLEDGSRQQTIKPNQPFMQATIFKAGTLTRLVTLYAFQTEDGGAGDDILLGGSGNDTLQSGAGDDLINGNSDDDRLFAGDGNDVLWGGPGHDHLFGGYGNDSLDVKPRSATDDRPADPGVWFTYGALDNYQGLDIIYGGWDQDAMQADVGGPGPVDGD
ncbi:MAG TPA: calcium-binding protein, partial [Herpetosiphonaceae bacterium]|nr:calcium-binding protein [Herpetosiphonaceae bacterium]